MKRVISASSNKGDIVLDPFVGSGTTCAVANFLDRKWIGFDINPDYIKMSTNRVKTEISILDSIDPREDRTPQNIKKESKQPALLY